MLPVIALLMIFTIPLDLDGQIFGGDLLNEAPLMAIPEEMTFEEYRDMNRRLTVGLALAAIPIPGMIHFYADEPGKGWLILGTAAGGALSILAGAMGTDEGDFPDSDYSLLVLNAGKDNEKRYEKIPHEIFGSDTTFRLQEIYREHEGAGGLLVLLGAAVIICDIAYDFIHGVRIIEEKRDRVRFKYGKQMSDVMIEPSFNLRERSAGVKLSFAF
jgi:hypothetical protein